VAPVCAFGFAAVAAAVVDRRRGPFGIASSFATSVELVVC
jgi:hypothetical protein